MCRDFSHRDSFANIRKNMHLAVEQSGLPKDPWLREFHKAVKSFSADQRYSRLNFCGHGWYEFVVFMIIHYAGSQDQAIQEQIIENLWRFVDAIVARNRTRQIAWKFHQLVLQKQEPKSLEEIVKYLTNYDVDVVQIKVLVSLALVAV